MARIIILLMLMLNQLVSQDEIYPKFEYNNYVYASGNVLNGMRTASFGYWGSQATRGINITLRKNGDIDLSQRTHTDMGIGLNEAQLIKGPSFTSIRASYRYYPEETKGVFAGFGASYNILEHGENEEYDEHFSFFNSLLLPFSKTKHWDEPYSTMMIEGGFWVSADDMPFVLGLIVTLHPLVGEFTRDGANWDVKGYFTPYNITLVFEIGLKYRTTSNKSFKLTHMQWSAKRK